MVLFRKEAGDPFGGDVRFDAGGIKPLSSAGDGIGIDIGGEDLELDAQISGGDFLAEQHGQRICFFACAASGDPNPHRPVGRMAAHQIWNDFRREQIKDRRVTEEIGDVDKQVFCEQVEFVRIALQDLYVSIRIPDIDRCHHHAPFNPALQRARLVEREIVGCLGTEKVDDRR